MSINNEFDYDKAFSRNIGWLTEYEQQQLRTKKVAIAGMGGVGGLHLFTLARLGVTKFHIADFDEYEIHNFNRQIGATLNTIGRSKAEVMTEIVKSINPQIEISIFQEGVTDSNLNEFLSGCDLYIDGLDFFVLEMRAKVFARAYELKIPAITAGPIGMGTAYLVFMPDEMSFEKYFRFNGLTDEERRFHFLVGLTPKAIAMKYLVEQRFDLENKRGPSTILGCELCAGVMGAEALKVLLKRGKTYAAPYYQFFDAYLGIFHRGYMPFGNANPIQKLRIFLAKKGFSKKTEKMPPAFSMPDSHSDMEQILDLARWAPSGDNMQPWKFEIINDNTVWIHFENTSATDVYDFGGIPTAISCGGLLENIRIAASNFGRSSQWTLQSNIGPAYIIEIKLLKNDAITIDPLFNFIVHRSVDRHKYQSHVLSADQKKLLSDSLGENLQIKWFETFDERWKMAKVNFSTTSMRFAIPELGEPILSIVDTENKFSPDKIPIDAIGLNSMSKSGMKWSLKKWSRLEFMNKYMGASLFSGLELDFFPGLACSAHFIIWPKSQNANYPDLESQLRAGESIQRFWLTATRIGLVLQPSFAPLLFAYYANNNINFSKDDSALSKVKKQVVAINNLFGAKNILFKGRIGVPISKCITSRSVRKPLSALLIQTKKKE